MGVVVVLIAASMTLSAQTPNLPARDLVRATVANELAAAHNSAAKFMFRSRKQTPKGTQNRIYVEANEALATLTIGENDRPFSAQKERAETDQLSSLANNPEQLRKKQIREKQEMEHTFCIMKALPDAFQYEYAGTESSADGLGKAGDQLVRLKFTPNPSYTPPTRVEQVLEGMQGFLLIDLRAKRLARIDGTLFKDVTFGWGIFGRLDQGGRFRVQQADVGDGFWEVTAMNLNFNGKILLFKTLNIVSDEIFSDFQRLPENVPFARGVELLQSEQMKIAQNPATNLESVDNESARNQK